MSYWVYENWQADNKAVIHHSKCGRCKDGKGCHNNKHGERNGRWLGPFQNLDTANQAAKATGRSLREDSCISKY